ncbi:PSD1 and planctomycete cytochrome C domain-containing protein [Thalassoroseus pseudoceratinae]|uniref:PSD1 and planctomycete cytochrome C domain-containing protein n=1 Tax=Thalassoroseus pseudoceratinae TaxID=2713176 RepID=UPI00141F9377|nr:PSD1 and planctomycete cytochrome C domain-containing protein [Thalassoroseus pseudoceratinae]
MVFRQFHRLPSTILTSLVLVGLATSLSADEPILFETKIQPIFEAKCGKCHSDTVHKGELNVSSMAGLIKGGESGESAIGEDIDSSMLWLMVDGGGMPPEDQPQLTEDELGLVEAWLRAGAPAKKPVVKTEKTLNQHDVLPIFLLRCVACHGNRRKDGGLDLSSVAAFQKGGKSGPAYVPGKPDESLLIKRIESEECPPGHLLLKFFVRRPPSSEVQTLKDWIAAGAPIEDVQPDVATTEPDSAVTDEDREHWAFQPPKATDSQTSIDEFLEARLHEVGLEFAPKADRNTLIRRAYYDLTGLPPTLEELSRWRDETSEDWYAVMVDHLLASPRYGERWGRYWLDLAGYADSEGGVSSDPIREAAWKYRDYVIKSFNNDKPYDRFLTEQIAGDELIDVEKADVVTDQMVENLVATGFLRMGIDQTGSRTMNFVPERLGVINDVIAVMGSSVMGLTLECCRCHSHKYDPLPQRDYYRFKAIFKGALDEHDWLSFKTRKLRFATPEHKQRVKEHNPPIQKKLKSLQTQLRNATKSLRHETLKYHYPDLTEDDINHGIAALRIADNTRTLRQRNLVEKLVRAELRPDSEQSKTILETRKQIETLERSIRETQTQLVPSFAIRALWDRGQPTPTYLLRRGEHNLPGPLVGPGVPSVLTDGQTPFTPEPPFPNGTPKTGRRLALARWLTEPDHPLTARVMVNRIWFHHFGRGLVATLENFGKQGEKPSHPELLDWLAVEFVERGWSIKEMHRLIMNSRAYQQSSRVSEVALEHDPQNILLSRMPMSRLDAEALRDALHFVAGKLNTKMGGPPASVSVDRDGLVSVNPTPEGTWRRSIYVQHRRTEIPTLMKTFDYPEMGPNCTVRTISIVSPQPLMLMHDAHVRDLATAFAERVEQEFADDPDITDEDRIEFIWNLALSRSPSEDELQAGRIALRDLRSLTGDDALITYCHVVLNSAAFLYID